MGSIPTGYASLPQGAGYGSLSQGAVTRLNNAGVPDSVIGIADSVVGSTVNAVGTAQNGGFPQTDIPVAPTTQQQQTAAPVDTSQLDAQDPTYSGLTQAHVAVLRAIGTPEGIIGQINAQNPNAGELDSYIQTEIMAHPEGWDQFVGNPAGTARAGLQQLIPGIQLPPAAGGTIVQQGGTVTTGITPTTVEQAKTDGMNDLMKGLIWAAAGIGVAFIGYKLLKGRGASKAAEVAAQQAAEGGGAAAAVQRTLGMTQEGVAGVEALAHAGGMGSPGISYQLMQGLGPGGTERMARSGFFSMNFNHPLGATLDHSLAELALETGQMRDFALFKHGGAIAGAFGAGGAAAAAPSGPLARLLEGDKLEKLVKLADLV